MPAHDPETPRERVEATILKLTTEGATQTVRTINARMRATFGTGVRTELVTEILAEWQDDEVTRRRLPDHTEMRWRKVLEDIYRDACEQADATFRTDRQKFERKIASLQADEDTHNTALDTLTRERDDALNALEAAEGARKALADANAEQARQIEDLRAALTEAENKSGRLGTDLRILEGRLDEQQAILKTLRPS